MRLPGPSAPCADSATMAAQSATDGGGPRAVRRRRRDWLARLVPLGSVLVAAALLLLKLTTRRRLVHAQALLGYWERGEPVLLAFWHERLLMMPFPYRGRRVCIMVSRHRDGELVTRAVRPLGIETARGSSTRGWSGGLKAMLRAHRRGSDLAFAPDGPRGPRHVVKRGVIQVARATGAPIVPVAAAARWCVRLGSWDRLILPLPFSRIVYVAGNLLEVRGDATPAEVEEAREALEHELGRITALADATAEGPRRAARPR